MAEVRLAIYQDQAGGLPLWSETQAVKVAGDGRFSALLGATSPGGLDQTLFPAGEPRWVEAQLIESKLDAGSSDYLDAQTVNSIPRVRSLLAAVPYAFKSMDAETLAGRAAEDYVTREDLKSSVAEQVQALSSTAEVHLFGVGGTLTGSGTAGYLPVWIAPTTLGDSIIAESGNNVGIGTNAPATMLDVNGASTLRGAVTLLAAAATLTAGTNSPALELGANTYSRATNASVAQNFLWQAVSEGNNTASPTASLSLLFGSGTTPPTPTGLSIAPNGQIRFAPGQTFPDAESASGPSGDTATLTGVTAGPGLTGGGSSGNVTLALSMPISPANGGTGATTPIGALQNLGISNAPAANYPGADCGAKINAADAALGSRSGIFQVSQQCRTAWNTPWSLQSGHELEFAQGGTYTTAAVITMAQNTSIKGMPSATNRAPVTIQEAAGANLAEVIHMTGAYDVLEDIAIDGNKANNPGGGYGVFVDNANRVAFKGVSIGNAKVDNIHVTGANSCCGRIIDGSFLIGAGNDDLYINGVADWIISTTEFENAGAWGIEGLNAATIRINNCDIGANGTISGGGIKVSVTSGHHAGGWIVSGCQFGFNLGTDFYSDGSAAAWSNGSHAITGNSFFGLGAVTGNTYDSIHLHDSGNTAITGNFFGGGSPHQFRYHYFSDSTNGAPAPSSVAGNIMNGGGAATADFHPLPNDEIATNTGKKSSPTASAGSITGTNSTGYVGGLSSATSVTITFANSGWSNWASCTASANTSAAQPYVSSISKAAVTFTFKPLTGTIYYHCDGE